MDPIVLDGYGSKLGQKKPKFQSKPDDYYELSRSDVASGCAVCWAVVVAFFFISVGFFFWSDRLGTSSLVLFCSVLLCVFVPALMVGAYLGSHNKMEIEERLIKEALAKITKRTEPRKEREIEMQPINHTLMNLNENQLQFTLS